MITFYRVSNCKRRIICPSRIKAAFSMKTNDSLGLSLMTVAPVAAFSIVYGKRLRNYSKQLQDRVAFSTQLAEERIANIRTVKSFAKVRNMQWIYGYDSCNIIFLL